jgi:hypothetical protein
MEPTRELIDELYRERVLRARSMPLEEKMLEGPRLFEMACKITMEGIRRQHPEATEAEVREILERRLDLRDRLDGLR